MTKDIQSKIVNVLKKSPLGLQMEEVADKLCLNRHTIAKYLEVLRAEGKIHYRKVGRSKLWKEIYTTANIRLLRMDDLKDILRIEEKVRKQKNGKLEGIKERKYVKEQATYHLEQGDPIMNLGAEIDGKFVGFVFADTRLWEFGRGEKVAWIKMLEIDPDYQGRGIGHKLINTLISHFKRKKIKKVRTLIDWYEGDLISYFKSLGFNMLNMVPLEKELK